MGGAAEAALAPLVEAQRRFQELADVGNSDAERMAAVIFTETGDCLAALGRLEEAAGAYEEQIRRASGLGDHRTAVAKFQLGNVRLRQNHFEKALEIQAEALNQLGNLYNKLERLEEAATFHRQPVQLSVRLGQLVREGQRRSNLAGTLMKLRRYDEARQELQRAVECFEPYGHAAEPWRAWSVLEGLERSTGHAEAAQAARRQAMGTYLAYRRAGGVSQNNWFQLFAGVAQAIQ